MKKLRFGTIGALAVAMATTFAAPVSAESLFEALEKAYNANPTLNAARAETRATDESVPQALSGYRPTVSASGEYGAQSTDSRARATSMGVTQKVRSSSETNPASVGITISQPVFSGFRVKNGTKAAESQVRASREVLRNTEQNVLLDAVTAYMDVLRDDAIAVLRVRNVDFLEEQVRASRDRFNVGEGTRTDVAQAEARLSLAIAQVNLAKANLNASRAVYRQVIGTEPGNLRPGNPSAKLVPNTLDSALSAGQTEHPAILAALHAVDAANFQVKTTEGELLPTVSIQGSASRSWESSSTVDRVDSASIAARVSVPIYQGGQVSSRVRQAKETLGQRKIEVDVARDQVRAAVVAAWGGLQAARAQVEATQAAVEAAQLALEGVIEEQKVGQRTTLDVLDAQEELLNAKIDLVSAQHDSVVASYSVVSAVGRLNAETLGLRVAVYDPTHHYDKVRDKWFGLRTPDGR